MSGRRHQFGRMLGGAISLCAAVLLLAPADRALAAPPCPSDCGVVNGVVNVKDLVNLLVNWGGPGACDVDGDDLIGSTDLLDLLAAWGPCPFNAGCGEVQAGSCYSVNGTPSCNDQTCCDMVCDTDPSCCETEWSQACLDLALVLCGQCGDTLSGSCCLANGSPGCDETVCCDGVCSVDDFCCNVEWDALCVHSATTFCDCP